MYTRPPLLRQSFVPWKGWEAQCPSPLAQCSSVQSGDAARGVSSTSLYKSRLQVSPESPLCLSIYSAAPREGLKKSPRHRRAPTTTTSTSSYPKTLQCVAQHGIQRLMIRGLGKPSRWSHQQRTPHPNLFSQLCLKWDIPTFLWMNCRTLQREGKEMWRLLCVNHHGV